jgi:hypothetical protein
LASAMILPFASNGSYRGTTPFALVYRRKSPLRKSSIGRVMRLEELTSFARDR